MNGVASELTIRSQHACYRVSVLPRATGMTTTQVVDEALRSHSPPVASPTDNIVRRTVLWVRHGMSKAALESANAALDASRGER